MKINDEHHSNFIEKKPLFSKSYQDSASGLCFLKETKKLHLANKPQSVVIADNNLVLIFLGFQLCRIFIKYLIRIPLGK